MTNQFFDEVRHLLEIGICPVGFEHGEFRIVLSGNAFVAEVPVDFENLVEPAYQQTFQIQLRRDAQIKIEAERLVMRAERLGRGAAGDGLQNRRLHFQKAALLEKTPGLANNRDALFRIRRGNARW